MRTVDPKVLREVENLAAGLQEPSRTADVIRFYEAIFKALNGTHRDLEQDALALFDGLAMMLGQLLANYPVEQREGFLTYLTYRAEFYSEQFRAAGKGAPVAPDEPAPKGVRH